MSRITSVVRTERTTPDDGEEAAPEDQPQSPLFDLGEKSDAIVSIDVTRVEPHEDEGFLAKIGPNSSQSDILARWGGGKYELTAKNGAQKYVQRRTIVIAGEPKFTSPIAKARWRRAQGLDDEEGQAPMVIAAPAPAPAFDPLQFIQMQIAAAREEREARRQDDREREDARRREAAEAEERRRKWDAEMEERRRKDEADARERERTHQATMMQMLTAKPEGGGADAVAMLVKGLELGRNLGGGVTDDEDDDGEDSLASVIKQAVKGVAGGFMEGQAARQRPTAANPGAPASGSIRLTGDLGNKVKKLAAVARGKGIDPDALLDKMVGDLVEHVEGMPATATEDEKTNPETPAAKTKAPKPKAAVKGKKPAGDK